MSTAHIPDRRLSIGLLAALPLAGVLLVGWAPRASATCGTDTVVVYGPVQVNGAGLLIWQGVLDEFSTTTSWGRRYLVEVVNGTNNHVNGLIVTLDGQQWIGASECGNAVSSVTRVIEGIADGNQLHELEILVNGTTSSYATLRICHVSDPTFSVYGRTTFTKPPAAHSTSFTIPAGAKPPYTLRVINGAGDGSNRAVRNYLRNYLGETRNYLAQRTCRGWVVDRFNAIVGQGFGKFGDPPPRGPPDGSPTAEPPLWSGSTLPGPRKP